MAPTIGLVDGVRIVVYINDHPPPHIHAVFAEHEAKISIATGDLLGGHLPQAKLTAVRNWLAERRSEIAFCWQEIRAGRPWSIERK